MRSALNRFLKSTQKIRDIALDIDEHAGAALSCHSVWERHETIQCASAVILSGFLETFLHEVAEAFISSLCAKQVAFTNLPVEIQKTHYGLGGEVLTSRQRNNSKSKWITATPEDIARRLASVVNIPYELVWEAFADTKSNPNADVIKGFLQNFGINEPTKKLEAKLTLSWNTIKASLDSFIAVRNESAHTGKATQAPSPSDLRDYCDLLDRVAGGVIDTLNDYLSTNLFLSHSTNTPIVASSTPVNNFITDLDPTGIVEASSSRIPFSIKKIFIFLRNLFR